MLSNDRNIFCFFRFDFGSSFFCDRWSSLSLLKFIILRSWRKRRRFLSCYFRPQTWWKFSANSACQSLTMVAIILKVCWKYKILSSFLFSQWLQKFTIFAIASKSQNWWSFCRFSSCFHRSMFRPLCSQIGGHILLSPRLFFALHINLPSSNGRSWKIEEGFSTKSTAMVEYVFLG